MLKTPISRFRLVSHLEGFSFLLLLFIAMPLKYMAGFPEAVSVAGMLHGILFCIYVAVVVFSAKALGWNVLRTIGALIASVIPFGNFIMDAKLRRDEANDFSGSTITKS